MRSMMIIVIINVFRFKMENTKIATDVIAKSKYSSLTDVFLIINIKYVFQNTQILWIK